MGPFHVLFVCLFVCLCVLASVCLFVCMFVCLFVLFWGMGGGGHYIFARIHARIDISPRQPSKVPSEGGGGWRLGGLVKIARTRATLRTLYPILPELQGWETWGYSAPIIMTMLTSNISKYNLEYCNSVQCAVKWWNQYLGARCRYEKTEEGAKSCEYSIRHTRLTWMKWYLYSLFNKCEWTCYFMLWLSIIASTMPKSIIFIMQRIIGKFHMSSSNELATKVNRTSVENGFYDWR